MNKNQLINLIKKFCEDENSVIGQKNVIMFQMTNITYTIEIQQSSDEDILIIDDGNEYRPIVWVARRLARLELLATRIIEKNQDTSMFIQSQSNVEAKSEKVNCSGYLIDFVNRPNTFASELLYITSNAGEGKSTLINYSAAQIALKFKTTDKPRLLVPIPLGGRVSLRFDDTIMGVMLNHYRFHGMFYDSFLELVKLGIIIPALDGFEEMFIEGENGEGATSIGRLLNSLESSGRVIIAARKAFYESRSYSTQAKHFETINNEIDVSFERIEILKWTKTQRIEYSIKRKIINSENFVENVENFFTDKDHPILTRPILFKKVVDVYLLDTNSDVLSALNSSVNYFPKFVKSIIEREAKTKWFEQTGEIKKPLLTAIQHMELLSQLANEMWNTNQTALPKLEVELISELYCERVGLGAQVKRQIKERISDHPLLTFETIGGKIKFEHEEFYDYFVGYSFYYCLENLEKYELLMLSRQRFFTDKILETVDSLVENDKVISIVNWLIDLISSEPISSFPRENLSALLLRYLARDEISIKSVQSLSCTREINLTCKITKREILNSHFWSLNLENFDRCKFVSTNIENIVIKSRNQIHNNTFEACEIAVLSILDKNEYIYKPEAIKFILGITQNEAQEDKIINELETKEPPDPIYNLLESALRKFDRSTFINEGVLRDKLGANYSKFESDVLIDLIDLGIIIETPYRGNGVQKRFKISINREKLKQMQSECKGSYANFINLARNCRPLN